MAFKNCLILAFLIESISAKILHKSLLPDVRFEISYGIRNASRECYINKNRPQRAIHNIDVDLLMRQCFEEPKLWCNRETRYRTANGRCNNLKVPSWGMSNTAMFRIAPARYEDGTCGPAKSRFRNSPPSTEILKNLVRMTEEVNDISSFLFLFTQAVYSDVVLIPLKLNGQNDCCLSRNTQKNDINLKCSCMPHENMNESQCIEYTRSKTTDDLECPISPVQQINEETSFLDVSFLYIPSDEGLLSLRSYEDGKLQYITDTKGRPFPVTLQKIIDIFHTNQDSEFIILLTVFLRLHNFVAEILTWLNPHWKGEQLFQESRRVVIAIYQNIVYNELLPIILGYEYVKEYRIMSSGNTDQRYDPKINPSTINSFATAAFMKFHALPSVHISTDETKLNRNKALLMDRSMYDKFLNTALTTSISNYSSKAQDTNFSRKKFEDKIYNDILRNQDHGIPNYNTFRGICGLQQIKSFNELKLVMDEQDAKKMYTLYEDIDDVELLIGGMLEKNAENALVGPVFQCIIAEAFYRYKYGDRYYYEHKNVPGQFTAVWMESLTWGRASRLLPGQLKYKNEIVDWPDQLTEIKKTTASLLICIASDNIQMVQTNAFYIPSSKNPAIPCELIPRLDFSYWKDHNKKS